MNIDSLSYFIGASLSRQFGESVGFRYFTKEQLESLESLDISTITPVHNINKLTNLKKLNIFCINRREYNGGNEIDYSDINLLSNLEELVIVNNQHIISLDVSNLSKLKRIILISNGNLDSIKGLDKLHNLDQAVIVGNHIKNIEWIKGYLANTKNTSTNILEYNIYNEVRKDQVSYKVLSNCEKMHDTGLVFAEKIGIGEMFIYSFNMIEKTYNIAISVINSQINNNMSDIEKIKVLYKYAVTHLRYSYDELELRQRKILEENSKINVYDNKYKYINSTYEALSQGRVVCEGYVNMLNFLLNLVGIRSETVYCNLRKNGNKLKDFYNHAANRIKINGDWFYFDSQIENDVHNLHFFMKTREEFERSHDILYKSDINKKEKRITR